MSHANCGLHKLTVVAKDIHKQTNTLIFHKRSFDRRYEKDIVRSKDYLLPHHSGGAPRNNTNNKRKRNQVDATTTPTATPVVVATHSPPSPPTVIVSQQQQQHPKKRKNKYVLYIHSSCSLSFCIIFISYAVLSSGYYFCLLSSIRPLYNWHRHQWITDIYRHY